jgi:peptidoglycan/xylan/chitin deacetylase (PgdA/CDA1 family)
LSISPELLLRQVRFLRRFRLVRASFDDAFRSAATVFPALRELGVPIQIFACTGYARDGRPLPIPELAGDDQQELATMQWDELRAHAEAGVTISSHTVTHPHLTALSDDELRHELVDAKQELEDQVGRPCPELAYPYGEHDRRVRRFARAAGYERAYGIWRDGDDPYALHRLDLYRRHTPFNALLRLLS